MVSQLTPLLISGLWVKLTSPHVIEGPAPPMSERVNYQTFNYWTSSYQDSYLLWTLAYRDTFLPRHLPTQTFAY